MQIHTTKLPDWTSEDAKTLRDFLDSETGRRAMRHVLENEPELLDGADVNRTLVRNGESKGFKHALNSLTTLCFEQPAPERSVENYPSLDNEEAWTNPGAQQPTD